MIPRHLVVDAEEHEAPAAAWALPLYVLAAIAVLAACALASSILIPIAFALVAQALFAPAVQALKRRGVSPTLSAAMIVLAILGVLLVGGRQLSAPAATWIEDFPRTAASLREKLSELRSSVEGVVRASAEVQDLTNVENSSRPIVVVEDDTDLMSRAVDNVGNVLASALISLGLLFLLLQNDGGLLRSTVLALRCRSDRRRAVRIVRGFQSDLSHYLIVVTTINAALGVAAGLVCWAFGMPSPALWGVLAASMNFVPYLGTVVCAGVIGVVALLTFEDPGYALLVPIAYMSLSAIEGTFVTPSILGNKLRLAPPTLLIWLLGWTWLWGVPGALLAVPLLMAFKVLCEQVPSLRPIAMFLSRKPRQLRRIGLRGRRRASAPAARHALP